MCWQIGDYLIFYYYQIFLSNKYQPGSALGVSLRYKYIVPSLLYKYPTDCKSYFPVVIVWVEKALKQNLGRCHDSRDYKSLVDKNYVGRFT